MQRQAWVRWPSDRGLTHDVFTHHSILWILRLAIPRSLLALPHYIRTRKRLRVLLYILFGAERKEKLVIAVGLSIAISSEARCARSFV